MNQLVETGPLCVGLDANDDLLTYKSGIYEKSPDASYEGGHNVKLVGYGVENGVKYWRI